MVQAGDNRTNGPSRKVYALVSCLLCARRACQGRPGWRPCGPLQSASWVLGWGLGFKKGCFVLVLALPASSYRNRASFTVQTAGDTYILVFCVVLGYPRYTRDGEHGTSRQELLAVLRYRSQAINNSSYDPTVPHPCKLCCSISQWLQHAGLPDPLSPRSSLAKSVSSLLGINNVRDALQKYLGTSEGRTTHRLVVRHAHHLTFLRTRKYSIFIPISKCPGSY